jgi:hypothetical protein
MSMNVDPDAGAQKAPASVSPPTFGYVGSPNAGAGAVALPTRVTEAPVAVGKHGRCGSSEQQTWLRPPFTSTHCPVVLDAHAAPVHAAVHVPPAQPSSCAAPHGRGPGSAAVAVVSGTPSSTVLNGSPAGGQSAERA